MSSIPVSPRSYLFVPGNRPERFDKAASSGADAVILDLEDAVAPDDKSRARRWVVDWLNSGNSAYVRINAPGTQWFAEDVHLIASIASLQGIVLPKAETAAQIAHVAQHMPERANVLPILETARGFLQLADLCQAARVGRLIFGSLDLQADLRIGGDAEELHYFRSKLVLHSRAYGLPAPVDGVTTSLTDTDVIMKQTLQGKRFGFRAKLCIHPKQIQTVHEAYAYSQEEQEWARKVLDIIARSKGAAVALDGKMIDAPVILKAQEIAATS